MENHFFILSRLGFILKGVCSPLNIFPSYYYLLFLAPWPWLPGCSAKLLKTPPRSHQAYLPRFWHVYPSSEKNAPEVSGISAEETARLAAEAAKKAAEAEAVAA